MFVNAYVGTKWCDHHSSGALIVHEHNLICQNIVCLEIYIRFDLAKCLKKFFISTVSV